MIRTLVVADSGAAMASITANLSGLPALEICAYASGRAPLADVVRAVAPDIVLIDQMRGPGRGVERIAEVRAIGLEVAIVGLASSISSPWISDALHAGADAVVPHGLDAHTFSQVFAEVLDGVSPPAAPAERSAA